MQAADLRQAVMDHLRYSVGILEAFARPHDYYRALALAVRERMQHRWINTSRTYFDVKRKVVCYLSAEFLIGPHLGNNLVNLHLEQPARAALAELGQDLDAVLACEEEPGLGNGGLGRLAACYLDSLVEETGSRNGVGSLFLTQEATLSHRSTDRPRSKSPA
jgi:starch phosphorylase